MDPPPLFPDDRHDLGVDQDGVGRDVDFGLGVAEPGDFLALSSLGSPVGGARGSRRAVADLAGTPPGEDLQQDHAHGLRVTETAGADLFAVAAGDEHLLTARQPEQRQRGGICARA